MEVGLLQCDHVPETLQHIFADYDAAFASLFAQYAPEISFRVYDTCHDELPSAPDECQAYLVTGSRHSVYEDIGWIQRLAEFVRQVYAHDGKLVGICFGHQMIAHALGGKVVRSTQGWGLGVKDVKLSASHGWMQPPAESYRLLLSHQDQVVGLPPDGEVLGGNTHCAVSMFAVGHNMLGVQAHPEFNPAYADALMQMRKDRIDAGISDAARATLDKSTDEAVITRWISAFLRHGFE